mmetsp:Transcript_16583/g.38263  ORF Transcript_16583/g.38263 Transcript_16583/m.38263 type:complete len:209 (-) Transcript_16583:535-1161(-)
MPGGWSAAAMGARPPSPSSAQSPAAIPAVAPQPARQKFSGLPEYKSGNPSAACAACVAGWSAPASPGWRSITAPIWAGISSSLHNREKPAAGPGVSSVSSMLSSLPCSCATLLLVIMRRRRHTSHMRSVVDMMSRESRSLLVMMRRRQHISHIRSVVDTPSARLRACRCCDAPRPARPPAAASHALPAGRPPPPRRSRPLWAWPPGTS